MGDKNRKRFPFPKMNAASTERKMSLSPEMEDTPLDLSPSSSVEKTQMHSPQMSSPLGRSPYSRPSTPYLNNYNWHQSPLSPDHPSYPNCDASYMLAASQLQPIPTDSGTQQALAVQYHQDDGSSIRPFKAYKAYGGGDLHMATIPYLNPESAKRFERYRDTMLKQFHASNGGQPTKSNPNMRRKSTRADSSTCANASNSNGTVGVKDEQYLNRRKKNNEAAKKSRDRRRMKEDEIVIRLGFLEQENMGLYMAWAASERKNVSLEEQLQRARNILKKHGQLEQRDRSDQ